jgi:hypothetical protein
VVIMKNNHLKSWAFSGSEEVHLKVDRDQSMA